MVSSLLFFATVFIKISLSISENSILISFVPADNEIDTQNSHQNLVLEPSEWEFLWLTKAFISYLKLSSDEDFPDSEMIKDFIINQLQPALIHEGMDSSQRVTQLVHSTELNALLEVQEDFINYKGSCIIRMLHLSFGNAIFKLGIINYLRLSEYQIMNMDDIWNSFQYQIDRFHAILPADIKTIMNSWIRQDGFPIVHVEIKNNIAKLRQERYLIHYSTDKYTNHTWWIPITWTSGSKANSKSTSPKYWFYRNEDVLQLDIEEDEWVIFNVQNAGFYRVNYDEASWHRIIYALHFDPLDSIPVINRASIISDAFNLAKAGVIPFEIALNSISYITRETNYLPIQTALTELKFLFKYFAGENSSELFNKFCLALIIPSFDRLSQHDQGNDLFTLKLQTNLTHWACILGHKQCVQNVLQNFERWKRNSKILLSKTEKELMFCIAVKHNSSLDENGPIQTILKYYTETSHIPDRAIAISSLKCIEDLSVLDIILMMLLSGDANNSLQKQEILYLFKAIATKSYRNAEFISTFIITHHSIMLQYYSNNNIFVEILNSLFEILGIDEDSNDYYFYHTNDNDKLIETMDSTFKKNLYHQYFYQYHYPDIIKWINNNEHFISLEVGKESKNDNKLLEIIERSFQLLQSFYQENSSLDNLFTSTNLKNYPQDASYFFWKRTFNDWAYLRRRVSNQDDEQILEYHMLKIILPIFDQLGFEEKPDDTYEKKALRSDVIDWACKLDHPDCIFKSLKLFKSWRLQSHSLIPINIRKTIFCIAVKYKIDDIRFFFKKYVQTKDRNSKLAIEHALGCMDDINPIQNILTILNLDNSTFQNQLGIISSISFYGQMGYEEMLMYLCVINPLVPQNSKQMHQLNIILKKVSSYLSTNEQIKLFQNCVSFYKDIMPLMMASLTLHINQAIDESNQFGNYSVNFWAWLKTTYTSFDYHLPKNFRPIQYELHIIPDSNDFYGRVQITLDVVHDSDRIVLHATNLFIDEINVHCLSTGQSIDVLFFQLHLDGRFEMYLDSIIKAGIQLLVTISYGGIINEVGRGIYRNNKDKNLLITTQFQMSDARRAFPCFDEPSFKARFIVHILRPNNYITISNMEINYSSPSSRKINWTWDTFQESELISTYLVAFTICQHNVVFQYKNLKYWSHYNFTLDAKYSVEVADDAAKILSTYTGIPLPIKKIDFVEIPGFNVLGMENWGLITLDNKLVSLSSTLLYKYIFTSITFREFIIAHEIVHAWFGNLVTCETWEYFWLNEGFTRYFEWEVMNTIQPKLKWMEKFTVYVQQAGFVMDSQISSLPLNNEKMNFFSPGNVNKYDNSALIHNKGPSIVRMMHHAFGENIFSTAIKYYLEENKWSTGTPSKLWHAIDKALHEAGQELQGVESVATLMESWTSQPGYPVVHVNRTNEYLIFKQERFLLTRKNKPTELYWIPITITTKSQPIFTNTSLLFWMESETMDILYSKTIDDEWIIVNVQQTGFYRVNYDENNWKYIFKALNQDNFGGISEINRAQILDDLFHLAQADYISYNLALTGAQYLSKERGHLPWKVFFNAMENLYNKFDNQTLCEGLKEYIANLITPYYNEIQNYKNLRIDYKNDLNIGLIFTWVRKVDFRAYVAKTTRNFKGWCENPEMPLNQNTFSLCVAVQHSSHSEWELLRNRYLKSISKYEKSNILNTLGCSRNITTLTEYLRFIAFNDSLKTEQEIRVALSSIFHVEQYSIDAILNFFIIYHEDLNVKSLWNKFNLLLLAISRNTYTSHQIEQLKRLIKVLENKNSDISKKLKLYLSDIVIRKKWFDEHIVDIVQSLVGVKVCGW